MIIYVDDQVGIELEQCVAATQNEFSGIGYCRRDGDGFELYDFVYLSDGDVCFTQIEPDKLRRLMAREDAANGRVWVHRHPLGNGIPGPHNWSVTDNDTIMTAPLGGIPEIVKWSISMVRTPKGWVGRIDNHIAKTTMHVPVIGDVIDLVKQAEQNAYSKGYNDAVFIMDQTNDQFFRARQSRFKRKRGVWNFVGDIFRPKDGSDFLW